MIIKSPFRNNICIIEVKTTAHVFVEQVQFLAFQKIVNRLKSEVLDQ